MKNKHWLVIYLSCTLVPFGLPNTSEALYIDDAKTLQFTAKAQTRLSLRLNNAEGYTFPTDTGPGDLVQWRNMALVEIDHDLET